MSLSKGEEHQEEHHDVLLEHHGVRGTVIDWLRVYLLDIILQVESSLFYLMAKIPIKLS